LIFVTIGSMFPFDRLIRLMDQWAAAHPSEEILSQIGDGTYIPEHTPYERMMTPSAFRQTMDRASLIVAHAGMGSVISAAEIAKPIVLLPRRADLREHTTDHQLHTAAWLRDRDGIFVADTDQDLRVMIDKARAATLAHAELSPYAPEAFIRNVRDLVAASRSRRSSK